MKSGRETADVDGLAKLDFAVMSLAEYGSIEKVSLEGCESLRRNGEVALLVIVQAGNMSSESDNAFADLPDNNSDRY